MRSERGERRSERKREKGRYNERRRIQKGRR